MMIVATFAVSASMPRNVVPGLMPSSSATSAPAPTIWASR